MISARMDRQITIQVPTSAQDAYGEKVVTYPEADWIPNVWAEVKQQSARETWGAGKVAETDASFTIRYQSGIDETCRILYGGVLYEIIGKPREIGRQEGLEIMAKAQE